MIRPDAAPRQGTLKAVAGAEFAFVPAGEAKPVALEPGMVVSFPGKEPSPAASLPPFRFDLGLGQRLSGRLGEVDEGMVRIDDGPRGASVTLARPGVLSVRQRPGEAQVLQDDFETLDETRWSLVGEPEVVESPRLVGAHSLRLPAGGASITCRLPEPVGTGRLEVAFHDLGLAAPGQQWFVDLLFRGPNGPEPIRAVLGWADDTLGVESPRGPALAVQHLPRKEGWHRLSVRFGPEQIEIAVDGNELAHGKGPDGPLLEVRLATYATERGAAPAALAGQIDDLRLVKFASPAGGLELDPSQDEVRLVGGDQIFGAIVAADAAKVVVKVLSRDVVIPWSEIAGLFFRRLGGQGTPIDGLLVRLEWRAAPGHDPGDLDQIEGALTAVSDTSISVATPYSGLLTIPRDQLRRLRVLGRWRRIVLDPTAHHLGNEVSSRPPILDPPQPEGGSLERAFTLDSIPKEPAYLTLDVIQVVGEAMGLPYSEEVRAGWLRTSVQINGTPVDYLNRHITSKNETPERIRLAIPTGVLKTGNNRLRIEQKARANDPQDLDDMGVLGIMLEFGAGKAAAPAAEKP